MTYVYMYNLVVDTGLAPCVENGLLSLACCKGGTKDEIKTGIRYWIGEKRDGDYKKDKIYVVGMCDGKFLYIARITDVVPMIDYYADNSCHKGRNDDIYDVKNGKLIRNNRHTKDKVHTDNDQQIRDKTGIYVLLSNDFIYLGKDALADKYIKSKAPITRETKQYSSEDGDTAGEIIKTCWKYNDGKEHKPTSPIGGCSKGCC